MRTVEQSIWTSGVREAQTSASTVVFDIGGSWFRSGLLSSDGELQATTRRRALNYRNVPHDDIREVQFALVDFLVQEAERLFNLNPHEGKRTVGASIGAALDPRSGVIHDSGPIWGPNCRPFDLSAAVMSASPATDWSIANDVTAALVRHVFDQGRAGLRKTMLITIGSGIASRVFDYRTNEINVDDVCGLQGEIGHIPVEFTFRGIEYALRCDCGGENHLNAFTSGRGISDVIAAVSENEPELIASSYVSTSAVGGPNEVDLRRFAAAIETRDPSAIEILDATIYPLAKILVTLFTHDPLIDSVLLVGGVVRALGDTYRERLLTQLSRIGIYQISRFNPEFFEQRIMVGIVDDNSGLIGAGYIAQGKLKSLKPGLRYSDGIWEARSSKEVRYAVIQKPGLFESGDLWFLENEEGGTSPSPRCMVVIDSNVYEFHGERIRRFFSRHDVDTHYLCLEASESNKDMELVLRVIRDFDTHRIARRSDPVVAIGGGVLLDVVGFAASIYRRGIPYLRVPTTLLSFVDAGVGAKTGINLWKNKSRLGTYHPPVASYIDCSFLQTLDRRQLRNGIAEILKIALIKDRPLFDLLNQSGPALIERKFQLAGVAQRVVERSIQGMLEELQPNLWEHDLNRLVDFGHTFSPMIEMRALPDLLHGECVAIDITLSTLISAKRGLLAAPDKDMVLSLLERLDLLLWHKACEPSVLTQGLSNTTLHRDGRQRCPLLVDIGAAVFVNDLRSHEVEEAANELAKIAKRVS